MANDRIRREPPRFRAVEVTAVQDRSPRLRRITLAGPDLAGFDIGLPASSVRLLLPRPDDGALVLPEWNGNEFLDADGRRPIIRTLTPLRYDATRNELEVEVVIHGDGPMSAWAAAVELGDRVAVSGTGRGYEIDTSSSSFVLAGDETALPAISLLVTSIPHTAQVRAVVEVADESAHIDLGPHPSLTVDWHVLDAGARPGDAMFDALATSPIDPRARVWVAGEAAAVQRVRRHLFETLGFPRSRAVVRGYWKHGRAGGGE